MVAIIMVNTHVAKTRLSSLLSSVENKREVVTICRGGKPVARLVGITDTKDPLTRHKTLGPVAIMGDITAPLGPEDWPEESR